jgi:SAM-dependent methyltransferase
MNCRHCQGTELSPFVDLGYSPPSNAYLTTEQLNEPEIHFPLRVLVCRTCWLAQTEDFRNSSDLFTHDYAYLSSASTSWLNHAKQYCEQITEELLLDNKSLVIELACNDGYLLQNFVNTPIQCVGIEPAQGAALIAKSKGIDVITDFFSDPVAHKTAATHGKADLIIGNNVLAHVPDINDFVKGVATLLKDDGVATFEFPHILQLLEKNQFDTIYHEHFSYLSLYAVQSIFEKAGLTAYRCEEIATHGGSLRVYGRKSRDGMEVDNSIFRILGYEVDQGITNYRMYEEFQERIDTIRDEFTAFLVDAHKNQKTVVAYGAAAKGNTLLNYCGIRNGLVNVAFDKSEFKIDRYMPGSHIPICQVDTNALSLADYVLILPWNLEAEIIAELKDFVNPQCRFVTAIPSLRIFST